MTLRRAALVLTSVLPFALAAACTAGEEEPSASADAALAALEERIGFDGAVVRLDEMTLARIDEETRLLEASGADAAALETATTRRVLSEAAKLDTSTRPAALAPLAYDLDLFKLNSQESALCGQARLACLRVALDAFRARSASKTAYADGDVGGRIDMFRHTYWNALMVRSVGESLAKSWADAHETGSPENRATPAAIVLSDMDFHNNAQGRAIGARLRAASSEDVRDAVHAAIGGGTLRAVRYDLGSADGKMVASSQCTATVRCGQP